jgi:hypothetical protein
MTDDRIHELDLEVTPEMRALFGAGAADTADYDFERGLAVHLAAIGAPVGTGGIPQGAPGAAGAGAGAVAGLAAGSSILGQGSLSAAAATSKAWLGFVALPIGTAAVAAALWFGGAFQSEPGAVTEAKTAASSAPAMPPGSIVPATPVVTTEGETDTNRIAEPAASPGAARRSPSHSHAAEAHRAPSKPGALRAKNAVVLAETSDLPVATFPEAPVPAPKGAEAAASQVAAPSAAPSGPTAEQRFDEEVQRRKRAAAVQEKQSDLLRLEMESLAEAKRALGRDPARAFTIARDGERQFGRSVLSEERQHVLILALLELGRFADARRVAAPYLQKHPDSPFARRVQKALDSAAARGR